MALEKPKKLCSVTLNDLIKRLIIDRAYILVMEHQMCSQDGLKEAEKAVKAYFDRLVSTNAKELVNICEKVDGHRRRDSYDNMEDIK